jgi:hypothetical protein
MTAIDPTSIDENGGTVTVVQSSGQDEVVKLTAKVTVGTTVVNKVFTVTVKGL